MIMTIIKKSFTLSIAVIVCISGLEAKNLPQLGVNSIDEVVAAMTLEEKAQMLVGIRSATRDIPDAAGYTYDIPRLGIPTTISADGPVGLRIKPVRDNDPNTYFCTEFPCSSLLASTWDIQLISKVGEAMGQEVKDYGIDVLLGPGLNIQRNPLNGRNFEYFSEDPILTGKMGAAMVNGMQSIGIGACIKHFAGNNQETNRSNNDARISQRALRELYLKGFEICIKESNPWTLMASYNRLNGDFTQENRDLLTSVLREDWGYKGIVETDWTDQRNTPRQVKAGNDLMMPGCKGQVDEIIEHVKKGKLAQADVDLCVKRILEYIIKTPSFKKYKASNKPDLKAHAIVSRESAGEGMVLLKNEGNALPLNQQDLKVALFGANSYKSISGGMGAANVNKPYIIDIVQGLENAGYAIEPVMKDIYEKYRAYQEVKITQEPNANGWTFISYRRPILPEMEVDKAFIESRAQETDVAILSFGRTSREGTDRKVDGDFNLTETERILLKQVCKEFHARNKKVIVVLNVCSAVETSSWKDLPDAILLAWLPGMENGNAVADVISGKVNPSGKLPMTYPIDYADVPSSRNFPMEGISKSRKDVDYTNYEEDIWVGYRYFTTASKDVSYPFGYGLSYTVFKYSNAKVKQSKGMWQATVKVTNTGKVSGKEVVQLYVAAPAGDLRKPSCELRAFGKTRLLSPGESQVVTMTFSSFDLSSFHEDISSWVADKGNYKALFAASVSDIRIRVPFFLSKANVIKTSNALAPKTTINKLDF